MNYNIIPAALIITLIITVLFSLIARRPMRGLWLFFVIIFMATWSGQLWIRPIGPMVWGVTWIPLVFISLFFAFLIIAFSAPLTLNKKAGETSTDNAFIAIGFFFWMIIILLIISIVLGYYGTPVN